MHPVESDRPGVPANGPERFRPSGSGARCLRRGTSAGTGQHPWGKGEISGGEVTGRPSRARPALTPPRVPLPSMEENRGSALGWISMAWGVQVGGQLAVPLASALHRRATHTLPRDADEMASIDPS